MSRLLIGQLALRYLRGKGSSNAVPILSRVSMVAIAVGSGAMIVLFSVFNGFEGLIKDLYKAFYPEIKISAARGKFFPMDKQGFAKISDLDGVLAVTGVIEDHVLIASNGEQQVASLKGIDSIYFKVNDIAPFMYDGEMRVQEGTTPTTVVGLHIANSMGLTLNNPLAILDVYYPNTRTSNPSLNPADAFQSIKLKPDGIFRIQDEFDSKYILASLPMAQDLFLQPGKYTSVELSLEKGADLAALKAELAEMLGSSFVIETRFEQNRTLYTVMKTEKWAVYAILVLVLLIASFNMIGALSLLVLEKKKDIAILKAMGATAPTLRRIFMAEGMLWTLLGGGIGLLGGALLCLGQIKFQWIKLEGAFIIEAYPVAMELSDFVLILATVMLVGLLAAWYPARRATRVEDPSLKAS
jgi:lipoprotein-releasing system permease protein